MEAVLKFLKTYVGRYGMFNLVLLALEDILGNNFVCPCRQTNNFNNLITAAYGFVPAFGCLVCTSLFVDLSLQGEDEKEVKGNDCNIQRFIYSFSAISTCVSLFFLDGRYWACARSDWDGVYTKSDTLGIGKWCKPIGNETSELESQQETLELIFISQMIGFGGLCFVIIVLGTFKFFSNSQANTGAGGQGNAEEGTPMNPMGDQAPR